MCFWEALGGRQGCFWGARWGRRGTGQWHNIQRGQPSGTATLSELKITFHHSSWYACRRPKVKSGPHSHLVTPLGEQGCRDEEPPKPLSDLASGVGSSLVLTGLLNIRTAVRYKPAEEPPAESLAGFWGLQRDGGLQTQTSKCRAAHVPFQRFHLYHHGNPRATAEAKRVPLSYYIL